ncbi:protein kinase domain-containing protein [Umezawaea sp. Da 62-37]|uniref:protein kinase domain-containing protein n=1 Tax=Umezawaea sp. Da 62-37 TaxID=3075927 RepID=UPI0028F737C1|nr:protein kinase [Umezawaea sp. Da 62-37]WNV87633.1 protein kinase [Umezawaea sp. Da 62-37]
MTSLLEPGMQLCGESGALVTVRRLLGAGGQGEVYEGRTNDGRDVAIKWYHEPFQTAELRESIAVLVQERAPSERFLWPGDIVSANRRFGYVMPLRPPHYASLTKVLGRQVSIKFKELVRGANHTVAAFKALQAKGLFYCDISDGNLFIDSATGDVLICDNDNVGTTRTTSRVLGTPRFMAPEIVRGEKKPSALTDSFSMAVLLFLLLMNDHPLHGEAESRIHVLDAAAMRQIYGINPVFIFDPVNGSNRPVPGVHVNAPIFWKLYPKVVRDIFTRVFTEGLADPGRRPAFGQWESALSAAVDAIFECSQCGRQNFYCPTNAAGTCWGCAKPFRTPPRLAIDGRRVVILNPDTKLYAHHLSKRGEALLPDPPLAEVVKHATLDVYGLKNLGARQWFASIPGAASAHPVAPGRSVTLTPGTQIDFGAVHAVIEQ